MKALKLTILDGSFTIHRLKPGAAIPKGLTSSPFYSISGSGEELSIVAPDSLRVQSEKSEPGWAVLRVAGTFDFSEIGILQSAVSPLARAGISIFAVSTFDTDYILVKEENLKAAREALTAAGHRVNKPRARVEEKPSGLRGSATVLLEKQIPLIKKLLLEQLGPAAFATLRSEASLNVAVGSVYEFLPTPVRLVVNREAFIRFCVSNLDRILPAAPSAKTQTKK